MRNVILLIMAVVVSGSFLGLTKEAFAQTAYEEVQAIVRAEVLEIVSEREELIMGTDAVANMQTVSARLEEGENAGDVILFESDLLQLREGDNVYLTHVRDIDGREIYVLKDVDRSNGLILLLVLFVALLLLFAGWQGVRALGSLTLSILGIVFVLLPALLAGYDPILMSLLIFNRNILIHNFKY